MRNGATQRAAPPGSPLVKQTVAGRPSLSHLARELRECGSDSATYGPSLRIMRNTSRPYAEVARAEVVEVITPQMASSAAGMVLPADPGRSSLKAVQSGAFDSADLWPCEGRAFFQQRGDRLTNHDGALAVGAA